jgi:transposase
MMSRLHQLLLELISGGAKKDLSAAQARELLARVRPRDAAGRARLGGGWWAGARSWPWTCIT